jgi:ABC-type phosphate transport system substrate-binding protein
MEMRTSSTILVLTLTAAALVGLALPHSLAAAAGDVAVVVRQDTPVDDLSFTEVRKLFMGDRQYWSSNLRVTLLIRAPAARERDVVLKIIYRMSEAQFRRYWISKIFRLEASTGPKIVYSTDMAVELVSAIPGAVAFMDSTVVPKDLKVLSIDGLLPGKQGYALR